jgi:hypothetical protein
MAGRVTATVGSLAYVPVEVPTRWAPDVRPEHRRVGRWGPNIERDCVDGRTGSFRCMGGSGIFGGLRCDLAVYYLPGRAFGSLTSSTGTLYNPPAVLALENSV